jgi:hypothetical protein
MVPAYRLRGSDCRRLVGDFGSSFRGITEQARFHFVHAQYERH